MKKTITLRKALKEDRLDEFVKEHAKDDKGEKKKFDATLRSMARKSKSTRETSAQDRGEN